MSCLRPPCHSLRPPPQAGALRVQQAQGAQRVALPRLLHLASVNTTGRTFGSQSQQHRQKSCGATQDLPFNKQLQAVDFRCSAGVCCGRYPQANEYLVNRGTEVGEHGTCKVAGDHLTKVKDLCAKQTLNGVNQLSRGLYRLSSPARCQLQGKAATTITSRQTSATFSHQPTRVWQLAALLPVCALLRRSPHASQQLP